MEPVSTAVLSLSHTQPDPEILARAGAAIRSGQLVAFPTETVYGLGANAQDAAAVARIYTAKERPSFNPLIVHVADADAAREIVAEWPEEAARLAARFWPGPLTLVLPRRASFPDCVAAGGSTIAVRVPAHPVAQGLLRTAGVPVAAPSANRSTRLSPTSAAHVLQDLNNRIDIVLDAGPTPGGLESTVLLLGAGPPRLLRPGLVSPGAVERLIGPVLRGAFPADSDTGDPGLLLSPGQMTRHYAPRATLELTGSDAAARAAEAISRRERIALLTFGPSRSDGVPTECTAMELPADGPGAAAQLYAALHALDAIGVQRILVAVPPDTEEWLAVRDRLRRAAAHRDAEANSNPRTVEP